MLDVRLVSYVVPLAEQPLDSITPVVRVQNFADEDGTVTGLVRIYRESTGLLEYSSELTVTQVTHGTTVEIAALTPFDPGAPADDDYFIIASIHARTLVPPNWHECDSHLGPYYFDIKPGPMGPAPAAHHVTHEAGGMDPVDLTNMTGLTATPQTPALHAPTHGDGQADEVNVAGLHGELADDQPALPHDITDPTRHTSSSTPGQIQQADANGLPVDATNTDAEVAAVVSDAERTANKGAAGGYCGLPNPLDTTLPLRADGTPNRPTGIFYESDLLTAQSIPPWTTATISAGSIAAVAATNNHPGTWTLVARSAAGGTSGWYFLTASSSMIIAGSESVVISLKPSTLPGSTIRLGFLDVVTGLDATDGAYIEMAQVGGVDGVIVGKTAAASARSTTGSSYTLLTGTWYTLRVSINSDASRVDYYLYSELGALLWTDFLTTNIPTAAGQETGSGIVATSTTGYGTLIVTVDYISLAIGRALVR